jgi:hypothetical protein
MSVRLNGSTSGYTELDASAAPSNNTIKMPASNGSAFQILRNGATPGSLEYGDKLVLDTAKAATGTSIDFTGIPSWVKRMTVMFSGVSTNGTSPLVVQIGNSGGISATGYQGAVAGIVTTTSSVAPLATGFYLGGVSSTNTFIGHVVITNVTGNSWNATGILYVSDTQVNHLASAKTLSGTLDRVRITTVGGTDAFDNGSINILYE